MKKEIGKWLMDIAKYVVTGGIISTFISNYQQQSWIIYINAAIVAIITFWAGTRYFKEGERAENSKKRRKQLWDLIYSFVVQWLFLVSFI